jgi:hypothetical protein
MPFDWINFIHAIMLLKDESCPLEVLLEIRVVVIQAIKLGRLNQQQLAEFDLRINTLSKQIKPTIQN